MNSENGVQPNTMETATEILVKIVELLAMDKALSTYFPYNISLTICSYFPLLSLLTKYRLTISWNPWSNEHICYSDWKILPIREGSFPFMYSKILFLSHKVFPVLHDIIDKVEVKLNRVTIWLFGCTFICLICKRCITVTGFHLSTTVIQFMEAKFPFSSRSKLFAYANCSEKDGTWGF